MFRSRLLDRVLSRFCSFAVQQYRHSLSPPHPRVSECMQSVAQGRKGRETIRTDFDLLSLPSAGVSRFSMTLCPYIVCATTQRLSHLSLKTAFVMNASSCFIFVMNASSCFNGGRGAMGGGYL